jgi:hypothetical protein
LLLRITDRRPTKKSIRSFEKPYYIVETFKSSRMQDIKDKGRVSNHVTVKKYIKKLLRSCKRKRKTRKEKSVSAGAGAEGAVTIALHT